MSQETTYDRVERTWNCLQRAIQGAEERQSWELRAALKELETELRTVDEALAHLAVDYPDLVTGYRRRAPGSGG